MTDVMALAEGYELEAMVGVKVFGWTWEEHRDGQGASLMRSPTEKMLVRHLKGQSYEYQEAHWWPGGELLGRRMPRFSREMDAAWGVVLELEKKGILLWRIGREDALPGWRCSMGRNHKPGVEAEGQTAGIAICRAAILAVEQVQEVPACAACHGRFPGHEPGCPFGLP